MTRDEVLALLWGSADEYISGQELADRLGVSRAAVWKSVEELRREGYLIESASNRGYRLSSRSDVLSAAGIRRHCADPRLAIGYAPVIDSTNTALKTLANDGAPEGTVLVAGEQTAGRGRMGRSFYSPGDTGVYLSLLLRPRLPAAEAVGLTAAAAVAVAEAIEELSGRRAEIKWVNDVLLDGKKVCGILTEASLDCETGSMSYAVVGVGVNALAPAGGFPEELRQVAGAVFGADAPPDLRCRLAAAVLDRLTDCCARPGEPEIREAYRSRLGVIGRDVRLLSPGKAPVDARVLALERDYSLRVRLSDGRETVVNSGEVSLR